MAVVVSISLTLTPFVSVLLLSTEYPKAVGERPSHPTLCARTQTGDGTVVPFTGITGLDSNVGGSGQAAAAATVDGSTLYVLAGATLVGVGTAALQDPRCPERLVRDLSRWCRRHGVARLDDLRGRLEWPT